MPHLILVKHSLPAIVPELPAHRWHLSEEGRRRCAVLADHLAVYQPAVIVSSHEPKAVETAHAVAQRLRLSVQSVAGLQEHDRNNVPWLSAEHFEAAMEEFFRQPDRLVMGNETADQAHGRFAAAVMGLVSQHPAHNLVIVAHGTVITLFVARVLGWEPFPLWKRLGLPSCVVLSHPSMAVQAVMANVETHNQVHGPAARGT